MRRATPGTAATSRRPRPRPGDRLVVAGAVVFAVGLVATLVTVVPFFFGAHDRPVALNVLALLMPVGLGLALFGLLRAARRRPPG
ncbi:MAG TPA: hypothetical protein VKP64_08500 [Mycobacteriales bacterium]|nr:hypothetical protein [Mycobacteriales bacterium]